MDKRAAPTLPEAETQVRCAVCGYLFTPAQHPGCATCPIHPDNATRCPTICCPNCGVTTINPEASHAVRWLQQKFSSWKRG